ncbi:MAG: hypothetical protein Q9184_002332 [Pyrenodesmia sp. 2 TL-2023]
MTAKIISESFGKQRTSKQTNGNAQQVNGGPTGAGTRHIYLGKWCPPSHCSLMSEAGTISGPTAMCAIGLDGKSPPAAMSLIQVAGRNKISGHTGSQTGPWTRLRPEILNPSSPGASGDTLEDGVLTRTGI